MGNDMAAKNKTKDQVPETVSSATAAVARAARRPAGVSRFMLPALGTFAALTGVLVVAAYQFGEGIVFFNDRTISDMNFLEVTGGAALGALGAVVAIVLAAVSAILAVITAAIGVSVGTLGVVVALFVAVGVVTGPVLLIGIVAMMIKRRYWPDVI